VLVDRLEVQVSSTGDCIELPERDEDWGGGEAGYWANQEEAGGIS
jgi:hypothetical protein